MSLHKLTAGSGYDYLTRQVAALDATEKGHTGLASYYTERGETPGVWIGSGLDGIDGLAAGDPVTAEQMRALFGCGLHPLAELRQHQLEGPDLTERDYQDAARLGAPFKIVDGDVSPFRLEVAKRIGAIQTAAGLPADAALPASDRARVRTEVAREFFLAEHGREPIDARELAAQIAKNSRPRTQTVAGYDLTFSPVKSVSTLWALAEPAVAAIIERAHQAAVKDALAFVEKHALFTRTGPQGIRQVNVRGLVAATFTHRENDKLIWPHCAGLIWPHPGVGLWVGGSFLAAAGAESVAAGAGLDDVGVEGEPVHDCCGQAGVGEGVAPFGEGCV
jgi:hypothetical protein